jgi:hypothetical protein
MYLEYKHFFNHYNVTNLIHIHFHNHFIVSSHNLQPAKSYSARNSHQNLLV